MKKVFLLACAAAVCMSSCMMKSEHEELMAAKEAEKNAEIEKVQNQANEYLSVINEVTENFRQIKNVEMGIIDQSNSQEGFSSEAKGQIAEDFKLISERLQQNNAKLDSLEAALAKSKGQVGGLRGTIASLRKQLKESKEEMESLRLQLAQKDIQIAALDSLNKVQSDSINRVNALSAQQFAAIQAQDKQLNTVWYIKGTKKELKAKGLKEKLLKTANINKSIFTEVDKREFTELDLGSKRAELTTSHPAASYSLERKSATDKNLVLKIKDYDAFWSNSKILVIQTR
jgi:chromosome segregation ATPase